MKFEDKYKEDRLEKSNQIKKNTRGIITTKQP